jgi:RHS repeat-associated protein
MSVQAGCSPSARWVGKWGNRWTGRQYAQNHLRARHYTTGVARFISRVPLEWFLRGENPYAYTAGNPSVQLDPSGQEGLASVIASGAALGGKTGTGVGNVVPGPGNAVGGCVGALVGGLAGVWVYAYTHQKVKPWDRLDAQTRDWTLKECNELHSHYKDVCMKNLDLMRFYRCRHADTFDTLLMKIYAYGDCSWLRKLMQKKCLPIRDEIPDPEHKK